MTTAAPYYQDEHVTVLHGDCLDVLRDLPDSSVHAIVTDPPYGLEFMGKDWDSFGVGKRPTIGQPDGSKFRQNMGTPSFTDNGNPTCRNCRGDKYRNGPRKCTCDAPNFGNPQAQSMRGFQRWCEQWATECLRVLKPGGHMLAFGGTRTWHRLACAVEDAGFEIRDSIAWLYGSGFPKSLDVSKAIDKAAGAEREVVGIGGKSGKARNSMAGDFAGEWDTTAPATPDAERWQGWGTALKPAFEPIVVARKPLAGTVAANVLAHGTGALNIDGCRVEGAKPDTTRGASVNATSMAGPLGGQGRILDDGRGRWPTNVVLDDTQAAALDEQSGELSVNGPARYTRDKDDAQRDRSSYVIDRPAGERPGFGDSGGASRFFPTFRYEAKAPANERPKVNGVAHPTVKPVSLLRWLVRLVTPPGGTILDPFAGSGTTLEAALIEGFHAIGIERETDYLPLIRARLSKPLETVLDLGALT